MTTQHPLAKYLHAYANGEKVEQRPNQSWPWARVTLRDFADAPTAEYRIAPETITVNGVECPKPATVGSFGVRIDSGTGGTTTFYFGSEDDRRAIYDALCKPFKEGV